MIERRTTSRLRSLLRGRVVFNGGNSTLDCTVREISKDGARLEMTEVVTVPDRFDLFIPQKNETYRAAIAWRREGSVGVAFEQAGAEEGAGASADTLARIRLLEAETAELRRIVAELQGEVRRLSDFQTAGQLNAAELDLSQPVCHEKAQHEG
jgi:hypothetical protein